MKFVYGLILLLACMMSGVLGGALTRQFGTSSYTLSYADFVSIMLTAVTLLITLLAFFVAMLAMVGWRSISGKVASDVKDFLSEGFEAGKPLHKLVLLQVTKVAYEGVAALGTEGLDSQEGSADTNDDQ